jgi:flagellar capping protein FliD
MVYTYGLLAHKYSALSNALQQLKPQNPTRFQVLAGFCFRHDMAMTEGKLRSPFGESGDSGRHHTLSSFGLSLYSTVGEG